MELVVDREDLLLRLLTTDDGGTAVTTALSLDLLLVFLRFLALLLLLAWTAVEDFCYKFLPFLPLFLTL